MRPPCEVVVRRLLPMMRALVARELMTTYGWTQSQTAARLGVTQPAVSTYLSLLDGERAKRFDLEELRPTAQSIAAGLATGELTLSETVMDVCALCTRLKSGGIVCILHRQRVPDLGKEACEACLRLFGKGIKEVEDRYEVLSDLKKAVSMIEECEEFLRVMPEVRVNIVMAVPGAKTASEVAGIPGRIIEVRKRARAFAEAEFGASHHMANVLLAAMGVDKTFQAVANIKYDGAVESTIRRLGLSVASFDRANLQKEGPEEGTVESWGVRQAVERLGRIPDVVVDRGEYGIEPVAYVFGHTAVEVAEKVVHIAKSIDHP